MKILRIICQRPYFTGSGMHLIQVIEETNKANIEQFIIYGQPSGQPFPLKGIIDEKYTLKVKFDGRTEHDSNNISFPVAGMSDQMPYKSTKFSEFSEEMLEQYLAAFAKAIKNAVEKFNPNIIHSHHLWLTTALCRVLYPNIPIIATCHNTALRQMELAPQLKPFVINAIKEIDVIAVQNEEQILRIKDLYEIEDTKRPEFVIIGQAIDTTFFCPDSSYSRNESETLKIIYAGKLSNSKGVPQLLKSFEKVCQDSKKKCELYLAGSGDGVEKENILELAKSLNANIHFLGQISQQELSNHFKNSDLFVLPSFYDGLPKVLLEALACGCKAVMTDLPGIKNSIEQCCGTSNDITFVPLPPMKTIDQPDNNCLEQFEENLTKAIQIQIESIEKGENDKKLPQKIFDTFGWEGVFEKYLKIYRKLVIPHR